MSFIYNTWFVLLSRTVLHNEHGVAEGKEPIPLCHGFLIGVHDVFLPGQGGHQHKQGGLRQVEIGDQSVNDLELVARIDEGVCPAAGGL